MVLGDTRTSQRTHGYSEVLTRPYVHTDPHTQAHVDKYTGTTSSTTIRPWVLDVVGTDRYKQVKTPHLRGWLKFDTVLH